MITLYHYVHCPFCLRVRMALGRLELNYRSIVLPYQDEKTPIRLAGVKMLPIADVHGRALNESLDIIQLIDANNQLKTKNMVTNKSEMRHMELLIQRLGKLVHPLAMPYWIYTAEFDEQSRRYFQQKKEKKRGPFSKLYQQRKGYIDKLPMLFEEVERELKPFYQSRHLSIKDLMIASHLWGLYVVPEVNLPERFHRYLQRVAQACQFDYHQDLWRD